VRHVFQRLARCSDNFASVFLPYIFSDNEARRLLPAATSHRGRFIWARMLRALILVLYCTGLRLGEAVRLRTADEQPPDGCNGQLGNWASRHSWRAIYASTLDSVRSGICNVVPSAGTAHGGAPVSTCTS
jgi:integrase